jgi:hypothetical protein
VSVHESYHVGALELSYLYYVPPVISIVTQFPLLIAKVFYVLFSLAL